MSKLYGSRKQTRFTKTEMLALARAQGFPVEEGTFNEWVTRGLVGSALRQGLGRGKGSHAWWSGKQAGIWLTLLDYHHRQGVRSIADLCNLPVYIWLYWGDEHGVSLAQVRRALETWMRAHRYPRNTAQRALRSLVKHAASRHARGSVRKVTQALQPLLLTNPAQLDEASGSAIFEQLTRLMDPLGTGEFKGPAGAPLAPLVTSGLINARLLSYKRFHEIPDGLWQWARAVLLFSVVSYQEHQADFAADLELGSHYVPMSPERLFADACWYLLTALGLSVMDEWQGVQAGGLPPLLQRDLWRYGQVRLEVTTRQVASPVCLPDGSHPLRIRLEAKIVPTACADA